MTFKHITKLMVFTAMSFVIYNQATFAESKVEKVSEEVKNTAKKLVTAAQREIHKHGFGVGLGQTFLMGSFEKKGDNKITGDLYYSYSASYSFDLLVNLHSSSHSYQSKKVNLQALAMSIKARSYEFDAFSPFLIGGLGFYRPQIGRNGEYSEIKNTFGMNAGAGIDLRLNSKVVVGLLGHYHLPFEVKQDNFENVRGSYFKLLLTTMYLF
jgi:opacity protein-like surface antigen